MPLVHWSPNLSVGAEELDSDHQELIALLNRLDGEVASSAGHDAISRTLDELIARTETHFRREEQIMAEEDYPGTEQHTKLHQALAEEVQEFKAEFVAGMEIGPEITEFLKRWLISHIMESDKHLGGYLEGRHSE